ncbi:MAG TPA: transcriptional regulator GcvA [Micropepsaceae bacterium]|nr:transcriptional regulator GcvA [Micropepsaceae bacterium]
MAARKLPPLNALRAFEATARLKSVSKAAAELSVTQSAVSHQVKVLEDWVGFDLVRRQGRALTLTDPGERYFTAISGAFDQIDTATRRLIASDPRKGWLTVSMLPSFAAKWLVPRLPAFRAKFPEIDVWIATWWNFTDSSDLTAFSNSDVELAIIYGPGDWEDVVSTRFMTEELFPVCSPAYLAQTKLKEPKDLSRATLLHDEMKQDWRAWLKAANVSHIDPDRGPGFDDSALLYQAAIAGLGVALGRSALIKADLASGQLVAPFALKLKADLAYYLVSRPGTENFPKIKAFREWLIEEAGRDQASPAAPSP